MASPQAASSSDEDYHSMKGEKQDEDLTPPTHPLKSMQGPFEESIEESNTQRPASNSNAELRRQRLLDATRFDESWITRWKQQQGAQYHPLLKLMAQITFGMHLLQQNQAKSDQEVVRILQTHVDEVDTFLEHTAEDFDLAIRDIEERIRFLQLPMQHVKVFNIMLDDKHFRSQLLDGNDKIERIIDRTARAMHAALLDLQKGRQASRELSKYLNSVQNTWPSDADLEAIYNAMRGNEEGWKKCYKDLQQKGNLLGDKLIELGTIIGEMSKMAATASRRVGDRPRSSGSSIASSTFLRSRFNPEVTNISTPAKDKPLPIAPGVRPVSFHQRYERPRVVLNPERSQNGGNSERPRTSNGQERRVSGPLSSHPPDRPRSADGVKKLTPASKDHEVTNGLSFARRWSLRKKNEPDMKRQPHRLLPVEESSNTVNPTSLNQQSKSSASEFRGLPTGESNNTRNRGFNPSSKQIKSSAPAMPAPSPSTTAGNKATRVNSSELTAIPQIPIPPEPKSRVGSIRFGRSKTRQSTLSSIAKTDTEETPSIASSIKRRTLSIRGIFSRRNRLETT